MSAHFWEEFLDKKRSVANRYGFAIFVSFFSLFLVFLLFSRDRSHPLTSLALMSVVLSAIYGGRGPALLDTFITSFGIDYFFVLPYNQLHFSTISVLRLLTYLVLGILVSNIVDSLRNNLLLLKVQKKQLQEEKEARENILNIVSHDLRSPLSSILMNTEFLLRGIDTGKTRIPQKHLLGNIKESSYRMNRLIQDLLDSVKFESGQFKINRSQSDLNAILKASVDESRKAASVKNINLVLDGKEHFQNIECDSERIIQVLNNLIGNAIKFAPENSEVNIEVWDSVDEVGICVKDQGPGISYENQKMIFGRWQAKETAHQGTGLGLFISKQIIEAHDGRIWVSSQVGQGSVFCFSIPKKVTTDRNSFVNFNPTNPPHSLH